MVVAAVNLSLLIFLGAASTEVLNVSPKGPRDDLLFFKLTDI